MFFRITKSGIFVFCCQLFQLPMIWIQFAILLGAILIGSRMKGIGLGVMGMVGLLLLMVLFRMRPAEPPLDVMLIIFAIVTTSATLQASGGLDYLVGVAERLIRRHPAQITFLGPFAAYFLCLFAGTSHVVYSLLPIISEVAAKKRIRPERPLSMSVIASHVALSGSPMSAATAAFAALMLYPGATRDIMLVCIPACIIGVAAGCFSVLRMGKELNNDPVFLEKMQDPQFAASIDTVTTSAKATKPGARTAVLIFGVAILLVVLAGSLPELVPNFGTGKANIAVNADGRLKMATIIEIITLSAAALMMGLTKTSAVAVTKTSLFNAMAVAVVSVFGVVWMSATFMEHNEALLRTALGGAVQSYPWTFAFAVFFMGILMFSQAATTRTMMPLGIALGLTHPQLIPVFPAVNSDFVVPGYPTLLAAINFDRTGTTRIGRFVVNHSFMRGGLVTLVVAISVGFVLATFFLK
jgi:anaerobic C4-dicarboxylate transporter DcuA